MFFILNNDVILIKLSNSAEKKKLIRSLYPAAYIAGYCGFFFVVDYAFWIILNSLHKNLASYFS